MERKTTARAGMAPAIILIHSFIDLCRRCSESISFFLLNDGKSCWLGKTEVSRSIWAAPVWTGDQKNDLMAER